MNSAALGAIGISNTAPPGGSSAFSLQVSSAYSFTCLFLKPNGVRL